MDETLYARDNLDKCAVIRDKDNLTLNLVISKGAKPAAAVKVPDLTNKVNRGSFRSLFVSAWCLINDLAFRSRITKCF